MGRRDSPAAAAAMRGRASELVSGRGGGGGRGDRWVRWGGGGLLSENLLNPYETEDRSQKTEDRSQMTEDR